MKRYIREILNDIHRQPTLARRYRRSGLVRDQRAGVARPNTTLRRAPVTDGRFAARAPANS